MTKLFGVGVGLIAMCLITLDAYGIVVSETQTWCHVDGETETTLELNIDSVEYQEHVGHEDDYPGVCISDQCEDVICQELSEYCTYQGQVYENECLVACGEIVCEVPQAEVVVTKYVCPHDQDIPYYKLYPSQDDGSLDYDLEEAGCTLAEGYTFGYRYLGGMADGDGDGDGDITEYPLVSFGPSDIDGQATTMLDAGAYEIGETDGSAWEEDLLRFACGERKQYVYSLERTLGGDGDGDSDAVVFIPNPLFMYLEPEETVYCIAINPAPYCGDGIVNQDTESCDDGNTINGDGCSATCIRESQGGGSSRRTLPTSSGDGDGDIPEPEPDEEEPLPEELLETGGSPEIEQPSVTDQLRGVTFVEGETTFILPAKLFDTGGDATAHIWLLWVAVSLVVLSSGAHIYLHKHGK